MAHIPLTLRLQPEAGPGARGDGRHPIRRGDSAVDGGACQGHHCLHQAVHDQQERLPCAVQAPSGSHT